MTDIYGAPQSEVMKSNNQSSSDGLTDTMVNHLLKAKPWAKFLGVTMYIMLGLSIISALINLATLFAFSPGFAVVNIIFTIISCAISFFLARYMFRYGNAIERLANERNIEHIEDAQEQFGRYCRLIIVMVIVGFIFWILMMVVGAAFMATAGYPTGSM